MLGFNYDNFDFSPYLIVNGVDRALLPPQTLYTTPITGRPGVYYFEKQSDPVVLPVRITLIEQTISNYLSRKRFLAGKLNKREPKRLVFSDEPDKFIEGILHGSTDLEEIASSGKGTLNFFCPDPYFYAVEDEIHTFNSAGSYTVVRNKGNTESLPLIEIRGTNSLGEITLQTSNSKIKFNGKLTSSDVLVFDSKFITSFIVNSSGSKKSANNYIDSMVFPYFDIGSNDVKVTVSGGASISEIKIYSRSRWT